MHSTIIKLPFVMKIFVCLFLIGCFTQILMYDVILTADRGLNYQHGLYSFVCVVSRMNLSVEA